MYKSSIKINSHELEINNTNAKWNLENATHQFEIKKKYFLMTMN